MPSTSSQTVRVSEPKPTQTQAPPRPVERPANKPFTIKLEGPIPA